MGGNLTNGCPTPGGNLPSKSPSLSYIHTSTQHTIVGTSDAVLSSVLSSLYTGLNLRNNYANLLFEELCYIRTSNLNCCIHTSNLYVSCAG